MNSLLKQLTQIQAVSGQEQYVFAFLKNYLKRQRIAYSEMPHGDIYIGKKNPRLLFTAHVDEVGFKITKINQDGTCQFQDIGWVYPWLFPGQHVQIRTTSNGLVNGIVLYEKAFEKVTRWSQLRIDVGVTSPDGLAKIGIEKGCLGSYKKEYWETEEKIFGTALDNRLGVWSLLYLLVKYKKKLPLDIGFAFTSYEEMTNDGAKITVPFLKPEYLCIVDIMPHSLMDNPKKIHAGTGPYILKKTPDYELPAGWQEIFAHLPHQHISGKSHYLKNSEAKIFQRLGIKNSMNFMYLVKNYHHGTYACEKQAISDTLASMESILQLFLKK